MRDIIRAIYREGEREREDGSRANTSSRSFGGIQYLSVPMKVYYRVSIKKNKCLPKSAEVYDSGQPASRRRRRVANRNRGINYSAIKHPRCFGGASRRHCGSGFMKNSGRPI